MNILEETLEKIKEPSKEAMEACRRHWDQIAKPLHSLGKLEDDLVRIAGMTGSSRILLDKKALVVMCADNGVVEEGVTQSGQEVTAIVSENLLAGKATSSVMCRVAGADLFPVDIGIARDTSLRNEKVAYGTRNMTKGPAMTREEAIQAIETGIRVVRELKAQGYQIVATGEMGIGNTTTSSAMAAVFLGVPVEMVTGRGAGLSTSGLTKKITAIHKAIQVNQPDKTDGIDVLAKIGGFDLAGMAGVFLGGAAEGIPVVIDGIISETAAMAASVISPKCVHYMLASHLSKEPAAQMLLERLGLEAMLDCDMHLGEGTGAITLFPILDLACAVYNSMSTFEEASIEQYEHLS
jgi:nicotinate-nucleotide--dimethylbenzimidazole phosphoribosyltransferase